MKKSIIATGIIVVLGIGYIGTSWYTGNIIADQFDKEITKVTDVINKNKQFVNLNISYNDYNKGIFSSSFHLKVEELNTQEMLFNDDITIYHGPFPWVELKSGKIMPKMAALVYQTSKESNEKLWQAAGNKSFINFNAVIDYSQNINITANNEAIDVINEKSESNWQTSKNHFSATIDKNFNHVDIKGNIPTLKYQYELNDISLNNLNFSTQITSTDDFTNKNIVQQITVDNMIVGESLFNAPIKLNQLTINNTSQQGEQLSSGQSSIAIDNVLFGQQNLGQGDFVASYNMDNTAPDLKKFMLKLDKLLWKNQQGQLDAAFTLDLEGELSKFEQLDENNVLFVQANINLPLNTLIYLYAQALDPTKNQPDEADLTYASQMVNLLSLLIQHSPLIKINNDSLDRAISLDLYYSKEQKQARINGQELKLGQFWQQLKENKLPSINR